MLLTELTDEWPPDQVTYLGQYLQQLGAKTIVTESHYIDRDYIFDFSVFYARSFRNYDNHCRRMHFYACALTKEQWKALFGPLDDAERDRITRELQAAYLGFVVLKPLPGSPIVVQLSALFLPFHRLEVREFSRNPTVRSQSGGLQVHC